MIRLEMVDPSGARHVFESELDSFIQCDEWMKTNKSEEDASHWNEQSMVATKTERAIKLYTEWLIANKITHTVTLDGNQTVTDYKTLI